MSSPAEAAAALAEVPDEAADAILARWRRGLAAAPAMWLPALPLILLVLAFLVAPALWMAAQSVLSPDGLTLATWARTLASPITRKAVATSLVLAAVSATVATVVGAPVAWRISRMGAAARAAWLSLLNVAANFGGVSLAFAYLATIGRTGMVTQLLHGLGLAFAPPRPGTLAGLVLAYAYVNVPLMVLLTVPAMSAVGEELWEAAQTCAATRAQFWRRIGLPLLAPFIAAGWVLIFAWSIGIYSLAYALAGDGAGIILHLLTLEMGVGIKNYAIVGFAQPAVYGVLLLLLAALALLAYRALMRRALNRL